METPPPYSSLGSPEEFKSYYVVWKREGCHRHRYPDSKFKSYYVVWKRNIIISGWGLAV